ncbi:MAG TPA: helix-turn-helix domain-containing protein [Solirubrobacteraceae bacterium]|nr:helix-turn-helix domain-containing protein [Solirubrobacteraceae bacterium]
MRTYGQYCSVARALDVLGDRWTLLIVRELLLRGPSRYTDLRAGLPGIATNLLAERLRELERAGVLARRDAPPPVATALFELTERGQQLRSVLDALGRWGVPLMAEPAEHLQFRSHWLSYPVELFLLDREAQRPPETIELRTGGEPVCVQVAAGEVRVLHHAVERPHAVLSGTPQQVLGLLSGQLELEHARAEGLVYEGEERLLARVLGHRAPVSAGPRREGEPAAGDAVQVQ